MKYIILFFPVWIILFSFICHSGDEETNSEFEFAKTNNSLGFKMFNEFAPKKSGNLVFSPYSFSNALTLIYLGTRGQTKDQIRLVTGYPKDDNKIVMSMKTAAESFSKRGPVSILTSNGIWARYETEFTELYKNKIKNGLNALSKRLDFKNEPEKSRTTINKWGNERTNGLIPATFSPGTITTDTQLAIANAIYFYGPWENEFRNDKISKRQFRTFSKTIAKDFMEATINIWYSQEPNSISVEIPYKDRDFAMLLVLPSERQKPTELPIITEKKYTEWVPRNKTLVHLIIPKFNFGTEMDLIEPMKSMGIKDIFSPSGDFGAAIRVGSRDLPGAFSTIFQKAIIKVDEKGTEAAAVTGGVRNITSIQPSPIEFLADHPFLFFIRHIPSGTILFIGKVTEP